MDRNHHYVIVSSVWDIVQEDELPVARKREMPAFLDL